MWVGTRGKESDRINPCQLPSELTAGQTPHSLGRISTALSVLAERTVEEVEVADARELAEILEAAARRLRERT